MVKLLAPYNYENTSLESSIIAYWVIPPPEAKPNEYGRPMLMSYSVVQDSGITNHVKDEIKKCVDYYKNESDYVNFNSRYLNGPNLYIDKLKNTLISKFPRSESETNLWRYICETLGYHSEDNECLLSIPSISKPQILPNLNSNFMTSSDISSLLFNSGKFPTTSSLLGLPDPMAHSTLAANNMFLSTNLFKMQELLKPLSSNSPLPPTMKNKNASLKIPADIKSKSDFAADLLSLKNKLDFVAPDLSFLKSDFSGPDVSGAKSSKDFSMADFSMLSKSTASTKMDLSFSRQGQAATEEKPLNLAAD